MATQISPPVFAPLQKRQYYHQREDIPNLLLKLTAVVPFTARASVPERVEPRKWAQDFQQPNFQTQGIPPPSVTAIQFRTPLGVPIFPRKALAPDLIPNTLLGLFTIAAAIPPFTLEQFPEIYRKPWGDILGWEDQAFLPGPGQLPFFPVEFPTPQRARAVPQDFQFQSIGVPPPKPFAQNEWPETYRRARVMQDHLWSGVTTRGIIAGVALPFSLTEWPLPVRLKWVQAETTASSEVLLNTVVLKPFAQSDFPNPFPRRYLRDDWVWSGVITRGIPPVPPPSGPFASVILEGYGVDLGSIILRWNASLGAAGYRLYINGTPQPQILTQRVLLVSGLSIDTSYVFNMVCVNAFGVDASTLSNPVYFEHGSNEIGTYHTKPWN